MVRVGRLTDQKRALRHQRARRSHPLIYQRAERPVYLANDRVTSRVTRRDAHLRRIELVSVTSRLVIWSLLSVTTFAVR